MRIVLSTFAPLAVGGALNAEKVAATVKIIDRQTHGTVYTYFVPSYSTATAQTNLNCFDGGSNVNCSGTTTATGRLCHLIPAPSKCEALPCPCNC
jgi:hypothetical protein